MKVNAVGLVGGLASGKNEFGSRIQERAGGVIVTTSDVARKYIEIGNFGESTRDLTRNIATKLRAENGNDYLLRKSIDNIPDDELVIVCGLYITDEVIALRALRRSVIVHINTSNDIRFNRAMDRSRSSDECDIGNIQYLDNEDMHASHTDQRLRDVIMMADFAINGDASKEDVKYWDLQIDRIFKV